MKDNEIKILSNMAMILPKIESKSSYNEEDYFYIYSLIDGYMKLNRYFQNKVIIDGLLDIEIENNKIIDLIRIVRNGYAHIDKNNEIDKLVLLQTKVDITIIYRIVLEIKKGMDILYRDLNKNAYRFAINSKIIVDLLELLKKRVNDDELNKTSNERFYKKIQTIVNGFDYKNSEEEDFNIYNGKIIDLFLNEIKDEFINEYGENIYDELMELLTNKNHAKEELEVFINKIKEMKNIKHCVIDAI